jgi:hypothetical protein
MFYKKPPQSPKGEVDYVLLNNLLSNFFIFIYTQRRLRETLLINLVNSQLLPRGVGASYFTFNILHFTF